MSRLRRRQWDVQKVAEDNSEWAIMTALWWVDWGVEQAEIAEDDKRKRRCQEAAARLRGLDTASSGALSPRTAGKGNNDGQQDGRHVHNVVDERADAAGGWFGDQWSSRDDSDGWAGADPAAGKQGSTARSVQWLGNDAGWHCSARTGASGYDSGAVWSSQASEQPQSAFETPGQEHHTTLARANLPAASSSDTVPGTTPQPCLSTHTSSADWPSSGNRNCGDAAPATPSSDRMSVEREEFFK